MTCRFVVSNSTRWQDLFFSRSHFLFVSCTTLTSWFSLPKQTLLVSIVILLLIKVRGDLGDGRRGLVCVWSCQLFGCLFQFEADFASKARWNHGKSSEMFSRSMVDPCSRTSVSWTSNVFLDSQKRLTLTFEASATNESQLKSIFSPPIPNPHSELNRKPITFKISMTWLISTWMNEIKVSVDASSRRAFGGDF
jgi:hypothetical protein